jgi:UDP-glucose 4-epimerase
MKVLVTGGAGYVGSHTVRELLAARHDVVVYDNLSTGHREAVDSVPLIVADIADHAPLLKALRGVDAVMHFAGSAYVGESIENPRKYFSSCATYGVPQRLPVEESSPKNPINPYGVTKLFLEQALSAYHYSHGLQHVCLRYFNAAGAHPSGEIGEYHDPETHLIPLALKAVLGTAPALKVFGRDLPTPDGTCVRDFVHVSDLGRAHVKALDYLANGGESIAVNLGAGRGTSIGCLLDAVKKFTGREVPHEFANSRRGDPPALYADTRLARRVLDWAPEFDLEFILRTAWEWETQGLPRLLPAVSRR